MRSLDHIASVRNQDDTLASEAQGLVELYNSLDEKPTSVFLHERILETWTQIQQHDVARSIAKTILQMDPINDLANKYLSKHEKTDNSLQSSDMMTMTREVVVKFKETHPRPADWPSAERILRTGYTALKSEAQMLQEEMQFLGIGSEEQISDLQAISQGKVNSVVQTRPVSVRELANSVAKYPQRAQDLIIADFEEFAYWCGQQNPIEMDEIRERLVKRKTLLEAVLPIKLTSICAAALTYVEKTHLKKTYVNDETMLGDKIDDIPQERVLVTEDNYIWDMEELVQAIKASGGSMRNPLSKHMFTTLDIRMILAHPIGTQLQAIHMEQNQLKGGVRPATISRIRELGKMMKEFQGLDITAVREQIDDFEGYCLTLSTNEQKTIQCLKIPGRDGFSGQAFDYTITQSVNDAKANLTCFHKVGDFLWQAAAYLQRQ